MQSEQQQRIMGYFIEEAKDHLNTIEQGLLNLQGTIEDPDLVNEVFRAAHSVKGGAAMLGLDSIQQTAHRLEDYFKVLKECPLTVDQKLESLFLRVFDTLQDLLEQLQGPFGLTNDSAAQIMGDVEPVLSQLNSHLSNLVEASGHTPPEEVDLTHTVSSASVNAAQTPVAASASTAKSEDSALQLYFQSEVPAQLRTMLSLFKQTDNESARQQLQDICTSFAQAGESFDLPQGWSHLAILARRAIANPENEFRNLAPALIKDFKQAQDLVLGGNAEAITPSSALQAMQPLTDASADEVPVLSSEDLLDDMADFLSVDDNVSASDDLLFEDEVLTSLGELDQDSPLTQDAMADVDLFGESLSSLDLDAEGHLDSHQPIQDDSKRSEKRATPHAKKQGPQVGTAELNSLADLFENEAPELGIDWQEEVIDDSSDMMVDGLALDASNDFSDLLFDEVTPSTSSPQQDADDISGILSDIDGPSPNSAASSSPTNDDFSDLFAIGSPKNESPESSSSPIGPESSDGLDNLTDFFDDINTESSPGEEHASVDADDVGLELDDILADDTTNEIDGISDNLSSSSETDPLGLDDDLLEELSADSSATGDIDTLFSDG
ncbi:MAG: Hpt domain-containing protein, partial [Cyanobacteria bacterium J06626_14]